MIGLPVSRRARRDRDRAATIKADIAIDLPFPRHRGDPHLAELRRKVLGLLGLDADW
jgi:NitT/TauT family transport system ATP-binding protein